MNNCKNCEFGQCTYCNDGYFLKPIENGMSCVACSTIGCLTCRSSSFCSNCTQRYYLSNNHCLPCSDPNCIECTSSSCLTCAPQHVILQNSSLCSRCPLKDCIECDSLGECLQCVKGKFVIDGQCVSCAVSNCEECVDGRVGLCEECKDGYFLTNASLC